MTAYQQLESHYKEIAVIDEAASILNWDYSVMLPAGASENRAEHLALLAKLSHQRRQDARVGDWLAEAASQLETLDADESDWQRANLREIEREFRQATAIPGDLVEAKSKATTRCEMRWRQARAEADFAGVLPALTEVWNLGRQEAEILSEASGLSLYDALLDLYEPGGRSTDIDALFADYSAFLPDFLEAVLSKQEAQGPFEAPQGPFTTQDQRALGERVMGVLGFNFDQGRLDVSTHPFCGGTPADVRMTTRYDEADFTSALMGVIHETGHGLYEQGLPLDWRFQPVGRARGMVMHESQSLFMEMQVGRSPAFLSFLRPMMEETFGGQGDAWSLNNLQRLYSKVQPSLIRVEADEVTYPAHVILRYRLERAILAGDLALADLPGAWNQGMQDALGIQPPHNGLGCLQDIHWYMGNIGYFPTYSLGAMAAAQLAEAARQALPEFDDLLAKGDLAPVLAWLRQAVHSKASSRSTQDILREATGKPLDTQAFKAHLQRRYLDG